MLILFCFFFQLCSPVNTPTELSAQIDMTLLRFTLSSPRGETSPPMAERRLLPLRDARRSPRGKWSQRTRTFTAPRLSVINAKLAAKKQHEVPRGPLPLLAAKTAEIFKSLDHQLWALEILWSTASLGTLCLLWYAASKKKRGGAMVCVQSQLWESRGGLAHGLSLSGLLLRVGFWDSGDVTEVPAEDGQRELAGLTSRRRRRGIIIFCWNWILFLSTLRPPSYPATQSSHSISISPCERIGVI